MKNFFLFIFLTIFLISNIYAGKLSDIKIFNSNSDYVTYEVEIVTLPEEQERGLMFREKLKIKEGMLFIFDSPKIASFWMKNTLIPLDLIYIKKSGLIDSIHRDLEPMSLKKIKSKSKVKAALEIPGGDSRLYDINDHSFINIDMIEGN
jgi:uncharacterized protein